MTEFKIDWHVTALCPYSCPGCIKLEGFPEASTTELKRAAAIFRDSGVTRTTVSGREPLVREDLEELLGAHIFVSLHTSGFGLLSENQRRLKSLKGLADILSLVIYSPRKEVNEIVRPGYNVAEFRDLVIAARELGFNLGFKTLASGPNWQTIPEIYQIIQGPMEYWKIYQFRPINGAANHQDQAISQSDFETLRKQISNIGDPRIQVKSCLESKEPKLFVDPQGSVTVEHPTEDRQCRLGNIHSGDLRIYQRRANQLYQPPR